jgi:hypothetical protein
MLNILLKTILIGRTSAQMLKKRYPAISLYQRYPSPKILITVYNKIFITGEQIYSYSIEMSPWIGITQHSDQIVNLILTYTIKCSDHTHCIPD